jgi:dTDP-4-amino-4,6-dideoxygalactose transaminase/predicted dehydrogenase
MKFNARAIAARLPPSAKQFIKALARQELVKAVARESIGRIPRPHSRLTGKLAVDGGIPVRNPQLRPWGNNRFVGRVASWIRTRPRLRGVFLGGVEGLPQPLAKRFAQKWAEYCGCHYGLLLPHGTDALRIALAAVLDHDGLDYGGEIVVPNLSFIASATAALDRRFGVVFVDVEPGTLTIDPKRVEEAIIPGKTRAIMAVHLFGQPADMSALREIAKRHNLKIVEDAAQAHGAEWETGPSGSLGDAAGFSFQSSKNLSCGEGGALTTDNEEIFDRAYLIHEVGRPRLNGGRWGHIALGWNCRPTEYQAALLLERFRRFEQEQERRRRNFFKLREMLEEVACVEPLAIHPCVRKHGIYMFVMRYRSEHCNGLLLPDFLRIVQAEGAPIGRAYSATMAQQPVMLKLMVKRPDYFRLMPTPVAAQAAQEIVYIPQEVFLGTESDMSEIVAAVRKVQNHYGHRAIHPKPTHATVGTQAAKTSVPTIEVTEKLSQLRCGIIGVGFMGKNHATAITKHHFISLASVTDSNANGRKVAKEFGCDWFDSPQQMIASGKVEMLIIATPHWQHAELSIAGLRAGLHVICEKPLCATVSQADEVLKVAKTHKTIFAVVHQNRFEPAYQEAKRILDSGELGALLRCSMIETMWRSEAYYKDSPWRGTWRGEGGGVLLNQAPHLLDRYAWLCGMPEAVSGCCDTMLHNIEVEDSASALFRHAGGVHGYIHASTNEWPEVAQTVIACDRGQIVVEPDRVRVTRLRRSIREATCAGDHESAGMHAETQEFGGGLVHSIPELLNSFYENVALTAAGRTELVCPGDEGRNAVELANAITLSSKLGRELKLPLDRSAYDTFMKTNLNDARANNGEHALNELRAMPDRT